MTTTSEPNPAPPNDTAAEATPTATSDTLLHAEVCYQGALKAIDAREFELAASLLRQYVAAAPATAKAFTNLGFCYFQLRRYDEAAEVLERAVALQPEHVRTSIMYASVLFADGRPDEGEMIFRRVLAQPAGSPFDRTLISQVRLTLGDEKGWADFECRWDAEQIRPGLPFQPSSERPSWDGSVQLDRTLCIHAEGGFGDTLMFCRFVPAAARRVGRVVLAVSSPLARLLSELEGVDSIVSDRAEIPAGAVHASFPSLAALIGTCNAAAVPYLNASVAAPAPRNGSPIRAGLVWAGSSGTTHDKDRSCPSAELLRPLVTTPGVSWLSLQVGPRSGEAEALGIEPTPPLSDFLDTAAVVRSLDLVVTVDSAVAHLAGALGVPTWIMVPTVPEYRWPLRGERTAWYPTARLFRRRRSTEWNEMALRMRSELADRVAELG